LARLAADPVLLLVNEKQPYKTLKEFIEDAKKRPEAIVYSSGGLYGATHLPVVLFEKASGIPKLRHLPTNGGGPAITALLGNNAQMSTQTVSASLQHVKAGKLHALASFGGKRSNALPDVPTLKELGFDVEYYLWVGLFAPKGTPSNVVSALSAAIDKAANSDAFKNAVTNAGLEPGFLDAAGFAKFWAEDAKRSDEAVKLIGRVG
jgi:tripartite-type tricarboxylate transporter receptor subunit TctC